MPSPETYIKQQIAEAGLSKQDMVLGLDRVRQVYTRMEIAPPPFIYTIAGTNGKGSCANLIYAALTAAGHSAGLYTSPHLFSFNERVTIATKPLSDEDWLASLRKVTEARKETFLTYFEYCTLAAFDLLAQYAASPWVLEVGLGGRLDAVNVLDPNCAIITSIAKDHTDRLGQDRLAIGREKLGIARRNAPLIYGDPHPPKGLMRLVEDLGVNLWRINDDYGVKGKLLTEYQLADDPAFEYYASSSSAKTATTKTLRVVNDSQLAVNLATAWQALNILNAWDVSTLASTWNNFQLAGRWQKCHFANHTIILDTAHNPQAARALTHRLQQDRALKGKKVEALFAMRADKNWSEFLEILLPYIRTWHLFPLYLEERQEISPPLSAVATKLQEAGATVYTYTDARQVIASIQARRTPSIFLGCGSFHTLGELMRRLSF